MPSPPQVAGGQFQLKLDVAYDNVDQAVQEHGGKETESAIANPTEGASLQQIVGGNDDGMDFDQRALAPAHEAPQAP